MLDARPTTTNWRYQRKMDIKPSAELKKRLFNEPQSGENLQSDINNLLGEIQQADQLRWNFDFTRNVPLPGRFKWQLVSSSRHLEEMNNNDGGSKTPQTPSKSRFSKPESSVVASPSTQRIISEFFPLKKRCSPSTHGDEIRVKRARVSSPLLRNHEVKPTVSRTLSGTFRPIKSLSFENDGADCDIYESI